MKNPEVRGLEIPEIKVIRFGRFRDKRGFFTEQYRKSDFNSLGVKSLEEVDIVQANESYSKAGVARGFHFQWNPFMGKLVRPLSGHLVELAVDIRKGSPNLGNVVAYDMPVDENNDYDEWLWVPPGFAHGNYFLKPTKIEYFCSGEYSPGCEAGLSLESDDLKWGLVRPHIKKMFKEIVKTSELITEKDRKSPNLEEWLNDDRSNNFIYSNLKNKNLC